MRRRITLSRARLHDALDAVATRQGTRDSVIDLRADAFGHGAEAIERAARSHGFRWFVHDASEEQAGDVRGDVTSSVYGTREDLAPLMTVTGEVISCKRVAAGSAVSYGYTYRLESESTLALVGLGYADGIPRAASNRARVLLGGARHVIAGRIAMDQFMVDLGEISARPGEEVVLWGAASGAPTPSEWALASGRPPLQLTTGLGKRFERVWIAS